jgi:hypothetical protein
MVCVWLSLVHDFECTINIREFVVGVSVNTFVANVSVYVRTKMEV